MTRTVESEYMSQAETARHLKCGRNRVRALIKAGAIPFMLDPETGKPMVSRTALDAFNRRSGELAAEQNAA